MRASKAAARGNLKSSAKQPPSTAQSTDGRNREKAIFHARLIQQQKDMELQILASIEALLDFPEDPKADPTHPSDSDTAFFKEHLRHFRSSDYDDLIEERNIDKKCGYALCPRPCREEDLSVKYRILHKKSEPYVVETRKMQKWCSTSCARHAMYVKVQLREEPAWVRPASTRWNLALLNEIQPKILQGQGSSKLLEGGLAKLKLHQEQDVDMVSADLESLALERGETLKASGDAPVDFTIKEKTIDDSRINAPALKTAHADSIEGYTPRGMEKMVRDEEDNMLSTL